MIILSEDRAVAEQHLQGIRMMLTAIGRAQRPYLDRGVPANTEARALSLGQDGSRFILQVDIEAAEALRGSDGPSWVFIRLHELAQATAAVDLAVVPRLVRSDGVGRTMPRRWAYMLLGRPLYRPGSRRRGEDILPSSFELPGPYAAVSVEAAGIHPSTGAERTLLDIGRTFVHELVCHAWRDVFFYQIPLHDNRRDENGNPIMEEHDPRTGSLHMASEHTGIADTRAHNLLDYEADLLNYYYDLARGTVPRDEHPEYHIARRDVMRTSLVRFRPDAAFGEGLRRERQRFIDAAEAFIRMQQRNQRTRAR